MLVIFIIVIVATIAICDFSPLFLTEDLESILYYNDSDEEAAQTAEVLDSYADDIEEPIVQEIDQEDANDISESAGESTSNVSAEELPYGSDSNPEDDFDSYDSDDINTDDVDAEEILQKIMQDSEII